MPKFFTGPLCDSNARIISLLGPINADSVHSLIDLLLRCDAESGKKIILYVSSQGGDIVEALKLLDTLTLLRSPVTAVGLGLLEGIGVVLLAACTQRLLFPSVILSTAGIWTRPNLHEDVRRPIGLHSHCDPHRDLMTKARDQLDRAFVSRPHKLPAILGDPSRAPQILVANEAIQLGVADAVISGPNRELIQPITRKNKHEVKPSSFQI